MIGDAYPNTGIGKTEKSCAPGIGHDFLVATVFQAGCVLAGYRAWLL